MNQELRTLSFSAIFHVLKMAENILVLPGLKKKKKRAQERCSVVLSCGNDVLLRSLKWGRGKPFCLNSAESCGPASPVGKTFLSQAAKLPKVTTVPDSRTPDTFSRNGAWSVKINACETGCQELPPCSLPAIS